MSTDAPLAVDPAQLPDEPAFLKHLVTQLFAELQRERGKLARLQHHMDLLLRKVFGRSSEKLDPRQALLFEIAGEQAPLPPPPSLRRRRRHARCGRGTGVAGRPTRPATK